MMKIHELLTNDSTAVIFKVKVSANARQTKWLGSFGEDLKVSVNATPEKGKANDALIRFFSEKFNVPKKNIEIIAGNTNTLKKIQISNMTKTEFIEKYENN